MKKFYVVGNRVSKSLSPTIFNYWFRKHKIKASYEYLELNEKNFDLKIREKLADKKVVGMNITIPFKKKIIKHVKTMDKHANKIGAVNCLKNGKIIKGTNTDWDGYYRTLPIRKEILNKKILLIGYGGAALAIHYVLNMMGFKHITILNRSKKKLSFIKKTNYTKSTNFLSNYLKSAEIIINTTPKNPIKKTNKKLINQNVLLSDIVYSPKETAFLKQFPKNKKIYGISMLLEQAASSFKFWFGYRPKIDTELIRILDKKIR